MSSAEQEQERRDYYQETIARLEPDIAMIDAAAGWASIAISLKRIADCLERAEQQEMEQIKKQTRS